jgi:V8-like Glu-specific endopeptidase
LLIRWGVAAAVLVIAVTFSVIWCAHAGLATSEPMPKAAPGQAPAVGALFTVNSRGQLQQHYCSASVVDSPAGDLVLTAAHCISGHVPGSIAFVPDYSHGRVPYGAWVVTRMIVDQGWQEADDPDDDFAFLVVSQPGSKTTLEALTGAETIGVNAVSGSVTVYGYPDGTDELIACTNTPLPYGATQLMFDCAGYYNGTSGGPFVTKVNSSTGVGTVIGVIGGYEQGGNTPSVSYAARFRANMAALYQTALAQSG